MNPDERLQRIVEEQRDLRARLSQLEHEIGEVRLALNEREVKAEVVAPIPVSTPVEVKVPSMPPPLPVTPVVKMFDPVMELLKTNDEAERKVLPPKFASAPVSKTTMALPPAQAVAAKVASGDFEMRLGKVWFVRIGVVAILTGLALGSVYAYQNFVREMPVILKVLALYGLSGLMAGVGMWLEKSQESLKTFGRVVAAGGLAAVFYTTYAMHHVERLRVIESPVLAGVALLLCAFGIFFYADRRKDQSVAAMSLVLGYYGTSINAIGWFSLFSNLLLTLGGLWLLWRHGWVSLGALSLVGSYGGFAFWQYVMPLLTTGELAPMPYWAGQGFLMSCWVMFTAGFLLPREEAMRMVLRGTLTALNNSAFAALFVVALLAKTPMEQQSDAFAVFSFVWGAVLLGLCWWSEVRHGEKGRPLGEMFLAFALVQISLGVAVKVSGYNLATVFAFQTAVLAWLGNRQDRIVAKIGAGIAAGLVLVLPFHVDASGNPIQPTLALGGQLAVILQAALLLLAGWFVRGDESEGKSKTNGLSVWICLVALMIVTGKLFTPIVDWRGYAFMFGVAAVFLVGGDRRLLGFGEMRKVGTIGALLGAILVVERAVGSDRVDDWTFTPMTVTFLSLMMLVLAWLSRRDLWMRVTLLGKLEMVSLEVLLLGAAAWVSWASVVVLPLDRWWEGAALLLLSGVLYGLGWSRQVGLRELMLVSRVAALASALLICVNAVLSDGEVLDQWQVVGVVASSLLLIAAAWLARHRPSFQWDPIEGGLDWVPLVHSIAAVLSFVVTVFWPFESVWQPAGWVVFCALLMALSKLSKVNLPELGLVSGFCALAVTWYQVTELGGPQHREAGLWLMLALGLLMLAAAMPAKRWVEGELWLSVLRWMAGLQTVAAFLHWWWIYEPEFFPLATVGAGLLLAMLTRWKDSRVAAGFAWLLLGLGLLSLLAGLFTADFLWFFSPSIRPQGWGWMVPVLAMVAEWLLRGSKVYEESVCKGWCNAVALTSVFALWSFLTFHLFAEGEFRTISWAAMALVVFVAGIGLGHPIYRRCGLAVLAMALGRVVVYDVWQLGTAARFASFLAIGGVLVLVGFFYNRFEDFIRKYL
ncbi:DUF2339 domain-containing protein [Phragmitibacter flavus]|nr:DUF2339 domain-containing protein [Phragmitibacter flavus]